MTTKKPKTADGLPAYWRARARRLRKQFVESSIDGRRNNDRANALDDCARELEVLLVEERRRAAVKVERGRLR